jgi:hypothetical protein
MIGKNDTVALGWCDNGTTDGKFTEGLTTAIIAGAPNGMVINTSMRVQGNCYGKRQIRLIVLLLAVFTLFLKKMKAH